MTPFFNKKSKYFFVGTPKFKVILNLFLFFLLFSKVVFSQTNGYWLYKKSIPNFDQSDWTRNPRLTEFSFAINDSVYVGSTKSFFLYERETNSFFTRMSIVGVENFISSFAIGNKGYVLARMQDGSSRIHQYDPISDTWTSKQSFYGSNASSAAVFVINNRAYIVGGSTAAINPAYISLYNSSTQIWEYNPVSNAFNRKKDPPLNDGFRLNTLSFNVTTAFSIGSLGYVLFNEDEFYQYDPAANLWYKKKSPSSIAGSITTNCRSSTYQGYFKVFGFKNVGYAIYTTRQNSVCGELGDFRSKFLKYLDNIDSWELINAGCINGEDCPVPTKSFTFGSYTQTIDYNYFTTQGGNYNQPGSLIQWSSSDYVIESTNLSLDKMGCINYGEGGNFKLKFSTLGNFKLGNRFKLLISDEFGNFNSQNQIGEIQTETTDRYVGEFIFSLSNLYLDSTKNYKLKIISSNPEIIDQRVILVKDSVRYNPSTKLDFVNSFICEGDVRDVYADFNGIDFKWFKNNVIQTGVVGSKYSISQAGKYFCRITLSNGCTINSETIELSVESKPNPPTVSNVSVCVGSARILLSANAGSGNSLRWYGTNATGGTATAAAPTPSTTQVGSTLYYVSQVNASGCESDRAVIIHTVLSKPTTPSVTNVKVCVGSAGIALTATAGSGNTLRWYGTNATGGTASVTEPTPSTSQVGSINYYVSQVNASGCESDRAVITHTVLSKPAPPSVTNVSVCVGSAGIMLTAIAGSGNTLRWYGTSATGGTASDAVPAPSTSLVGSTSYYVSQVNASGCESDRAAITYTVLSKPSQPIVSNVTACIGSNINTLTAISANGNSLIWYGTNATGGTASATAPIPSTSQVGSTNYYVSQINSSGCESDRAVISLTVIAKPNMPLVSNMSSCIGANGTSLTATAESGNTLRWYGTSATGGTATIVAPIPSTSQLGSSNYYVSQVNASGCESDRAVINFTVISKPIPPSVSNMSVCIASTAQSLIASASAGNSLRWYGTNATGGIPSGTPPTPSTSQAGSFNYYVSQVSPTGCESDRAVVVFTVVSKPNMPSTAQVSACQGSSGIVLIANAGSGNTLRWYGTDATGGIPSTTAPSPSTSIVGNTNYYVSQVNSIGCESDRAIITLTINPLPSKPTISWNGFNFSVIQIHSTYQWLMDNNLISGATSAQYKPVNPGKYRVRVTNSFQCADTSNVFDLLVTAVSQPAMNGTIIRAYPNPTTSNFTLDLGKNPLKPYDLKLIGTDGKEVFGTWNLKERITQMNLKNKPPGNYILVIQNGTNKISLPIIKL